MGYRPTVLGLALSFGLCVAASGGQVHLETRAALPKATGPALPGLVARVLRPLFSLLAPATREVGQAAHHPATPAQRIESLARSFEDGPGEQTTRALEIAPADSDAPTYQAGHGLAEWLNQGASSLEHEDLARHEGGVTAQRTHHLFGTEDVTVTRVEEGREVREAYRRTHRSLGHLRSAYSPVLLDLGELRGRRVLDLGTGGGEFVEDLRAVGVDAYGLDIFLSPEQIRSPYYILADASRTGLPSGSFEAIYSNFSMFMPSAHNSDAFLGGVLAEMARLLKPGGVLRISPVDIERVTRLVAAVPGLAVSARPDQSWRGLEYVEIRKNIQWSSGTRTVTIE